MKKIIYATIILFLVVTSSISAQTTKAVPISNGCGSESSKTSQVLATGAKYVDAAITGSGVKKQVESCDQHDKDYYNGVNKEKADNDFQKRSPIMGTAVKSAKQMSAKSYQEAQNDRQKSKQLQSTWEKEHKQCLDENNYRVTTK